MLPGLLDAGECAALSRLYDDDARFRSRIVMARHGFGRGEYKYFAYPLPPLVPACARRCIRASRRWPTGGTRRWGWTWPTPTRTRRSSRSVMRPGRRDPRRCCCATSRATSTRCTRTCTGRWCSRCRSPSCSRSRSATSRAASSCSPSSVRGCSHAPRSCRSRQGDAVIFAVHHRPVAGTRGTYRVNLRHGVSRVRSGLRHTAGIIFHDAA